MKSKMKLKEEVEKLETTREFKEWRSKNKKDFLVSLFFISDKPNEIQIDYYNEEKGTITSFSVSEEKIRVIEGEEVLSSPESKIKPLNLENVVELQEALEKATSFQRQEYEKEKPYKTIMILQNTGVIIWNITFITHTFKILNIKLNALTKEIISHKIQPIFNFVSRDK